jgi:hypothetical protein
VLRYPLPEGDVPAAPLIETPNSTSPLPLSVETERGEASASTEAHPVLSFAATRRAGLYRLSWKDVKQQPHNEMIAVNPDARECELQRIPPAQLRELWGRLAPEVIAGASDNGAAVSLRGQEIWRSLATGMLLLLAMETCFATWAGRQR